MTKEQEKFYNLKKTQDYTVKGLDVDYKIFTDHDRKETILQSEESDSRTDWLNNLLFIPWPLKLNYKTVWTTLGYARAYKSASTMISEFLDVIISNPKDYKICIRGWSFGSAIAKIAARHLELLDVPCDELTTYGDVKCWLNPFYKSKAKVCHEYVNPNDIVTYCVPFYHRDRKCKVGPEFKFFELFKCEYYHTHYEDYDYTIYEQD